MRVTAYARQANGSRCYGLKVRGISVLVTAGDDRDYQAAEMLAGMIAALGPEDAPEMPIGSPPVSNPEPSALDPYKIEKKRKEDARRNFKVGQIVLCNVTGKNERIIEIGTDRHRGEIKIAGYRPWCPTHNFDEVP